MVSLALHIVLAASMAQIGTAVAPADAGAPNTAKPWLDDPAAYFSEHSDRQWVVGRSSIACLSAAEAFNSACRDASRQLASLSAGNAHRGPGDAVSRDRLSKRIAAELKAGRLIRDRYSARSKKPYGEVWSGAVLVDASDAALRRIAADDAAFERGQRVARVGRAAMVAGLCAAILLVYALLNAVTRGYFRGPLRFGTAVCMLGVVLILHVG